jgi:hypothetical protein
MKNDIIAKFGEDKIAHQDIYSHEFHIVDYTERTKSRRAVEVHYAKPDDIDSLKVINPIKLHITASIFKPQCFIGDDGKDIKQCECVLYPTIYTKKTWILFVEIKDCKPKNASTYHQDVKDKFIDNVQFFRTNGIIEQNKVVYAVASFPRKGKTNFYHQFIKDSEAQFFRRHHKIKILGTNEITIKNEKSLS